MSYALDFKDDQGHGWRLAGVKTIGSRNPLTLLNGLTHLRAEIAPIDPAVGGRQRFVVSIGGRDLVGLGASLGGRGFTLARRLRAVRRFITFFATSAMRERVPSRSHSTHP